MKQSFKKIEIHTLFLGFKYLFLCTLDFFGFRGHFGQTTLSTDLKREFPFKNGKYEDAATRLTAVAGVY